MQRSSCGGTYLVEDVFNLPVLGNSFKKKRLKLIAAALTVDHDASEQGDFVGTFPETFAGDDFVDK